MAGGSEQYGGVPGSYSSQYYRTQLPLNMGYDPTFLKSRGSDDFHFAVPG
jgi:hypothetical protein